MKNSINKDLRKDTGLLFKNRKKAVLLMKLLNQDVVAEYLLEDQFIIYFGKIEFRKLNKFFKPYTGLTQKRMGEIYDEYRQRVYDRWRQVYQSQSPFYIFNISGIIQRYGLKKERLFPLSQGQYTGFMRRKRIK
jgi:hypothetical protein